MKTIISTAIASLLTAGSFFASSNAQAQVFGPVSNLRPYDKTGINVFEDPKLDSLAFDGIRIKLGAGFTQSFQGLKHSNTSGGLQKITPGFNTANANLFMDVQLAEGIRLNLTSYLSSRHHNETWVKGGYIQFDKLPFTGKIWEDIMSVTTIKVGHMEINYGDQHFRRSDGGHTFYNPFAENYILDAFSTEIGGEVLVRKNGLFGLVGVSNGMIKGNIDQLVPTAADDNIHKSPALYLKGGIDKQLLPELRVRLAASYYTNNSSGGQTLYGGDRTGSNYFMAMEKTGGTYAANAFSGRLNPGFSKKVDAMQVNGFVKAKQLELFATYENAKGRSKNEDRERNVHQYAVDAIYRIGVQENFFVGARYNKVTAQLPNVAGTATTAPVEFGNDVKIDRIAVGAGWFLTRNILLKGEYVHQEYMNFPAAEHRSGGSFRGYVIQAAVGF